MSTTSKALLAIFALAVAAACTPKKEEVVYYEPAPIYMDAPVAKGKWH